MDVFQYFMRDPEEDPGESHRKDPMKMKEFRIHQDPDISEPTKKKKKKKMVFDDYSSSEGEDITIEPHKKAKKKRKRKKPSNIGSDGEVEEPIRRAVITATPAMLPDYIKEYNEECNQTLNGYDEYGIKKGCKLCEYGDNGTTVHTTEVMKELYGLDKQLFRKVPDQVIWKIMAEKWRDNIMKKSSDGFGINDIEYLTEEEARIHYTSHDLSNIQRILWRIITFYIRSIEYLMPNGGIWQQLSVDGIQQNHLSFDLTNYKNFDKLVNKMMRLTDLSEKLEMKERISTGDYNGNRSGRPQQRYNPNFKKNSENVFKAY